MSQNTSSAVMQQRHEALDSLDDFPTPPWATRALLHYLFPNGEMQNSVWEPSSNRGYMVRPLQERFLQVMATDVHDYGMGYSVGSFVGSGSDVISCAGSTDWIITNPPFNLAVDFFERAITIASKGVALLLRSSWLEGSNRYNLVFKSLPPTHVLIFSERVPMVRGRYDPKASTATSYAWFVWRHGQSFQSQPTILDWIPPGTRKMFELESDWS